MWKNRFVWICLVLVLAGLALLACQGVYNRYWADDWCYDSSVLHRGLIGAVRGYFDTATYATNRFSLTLFSGFLAPFWVPGVELLPLAVILAWLGGLYWNFRLLARLFQPGLDRATSLLGASILLTFILWLAPNQFQNLMWRTGMLTYTAPLLGMTWLAGRFLLQALEPQRGWRGTLIAGLLSFIIGGFSEVGCSLLLSGLALGLAGVLLSRRKLNHSGGAVQKAHPHPGPPPRGGGRKIKCRFLPTVWAKIGEKWISPALGRGPGGGEKDRARLPISFWTIPLLPMLAAALLGGLVAMAVLVLSPMNEPRRLASYGSPMPLIELPFMALKFGYYYIRAFLSLNRYAVLALGAGGLALGFFSRGGSLQDAVQSQTAPPEGISLRRLGLGLLLTGAAVFLLVAAVNVPAAYIESAEISESRALLVPNSVLVLGITAAAWQVGSALRRWQQTAARPAAQRWALTFILAMLALAPTAYAVVHYPAAVAPLALFQKRAQAWDARDAAVRQAVADHKTSVDVGQIDAYAGILEMYPQPNWVNNCAATFYGLSEIRATLPWLP